MCVCVFAGSHKRSHSLGEKEICSTPSPAPEQQFRDRSNTLSEKPALPVIRDKYKDLTGEVEVSAALLSQSLFPSLTDDRFFSGFTRHNYVLIIAWIRLNSLSLSQLFTTALLRCDNKGEWALRVWMAEVLGERSSGNTAPLPKHVKTQTSRIRVPELFKLLILRAPLGRDRGPRCICSFI